MDVRMLTQLDQWHENDEHQAIVDVISAIPPQERDYDLTCRLARAYNNLSEYQKAVDLFLSVEEEGRDDPLWYYRLGYSYFYMDRPKQAREMLREAHRRQPEDTDIQYLLNACSYRSNKGDSSYKSNRLPAERDCPAVKRIPSQESAVTVPQTSEDLPANSPLEVYNRGELDAVDAHIVRWFGEFSHVLHEIVSPDIHVDIAVVDPTPEQPYYTLVTMGMGAHQMNVPSELREKGVDRGELVLCLPADWKINDSDERWYWPLRWLKILARLPGNEGSWLGWGHTVAADGPVSEDTDLAGILLTWPWLTQEQAAATKFRGNEEASICTLPSGDTVRFFQVVPIYEQEMNYKLDNDAEGLLDLFDETMSLILDTKRKNYCAS